MVTLLIDLALIVDIYSIIYGIFRSQILTNLSRSLTSEQYKDVFGKPIKLLFEEMIVMSNHTLGQNSTPMEIKGCYEEATLKIWENLAYLKPMPQALLMLNSLHNIVQDKWDQKLVIYFVSNLENATIIRINDLHHDFLEQFHCELNRVHTISEISENHKYINPTNTYLFGTIPFLAEIKQFESLSLIPKVECSKISDLYSYLYTNELTRYEWEAKEKMDMGRMKCVEEEKLWSRIKEFDKPVIIRGMVKRGKGMGKSILGMPTANIKSTTPGWLNSIVPGIYFGLITFPAHKSANPKSPESQPSSPSEIFPEKYFKAFISIGWNPQFDDPLTLEAYIDYEFEHNFYDEFMEVHLTHFLRIEGRYDSMGDLIYAMECDLIVGAKALKLYIEKYNLYNDIAE